MCLINVTVYLKTKGKKTSKNHTNYLMYFTEIGYKLGQKQVRVVVLHNCVDC